MLIALSVLSGLNLTLTVLLFYAARASVRNAQKQRLHLWEMLDSTSSLAVNTGREVLRLQGDVIVLSDTLNHAIGEPAPNTTTELN